MARGGCRWARAHLAAACLSGWAARPAGKGKEGGKNGGSKDEEPPPFRRSRLSDSRESSPGAPRPASAHVIPGPPLPPPLAREAASSALPSRGAATWPAPCGGAGSGRAGRADPPESRLSSKTLPKCPGSRFKGQTLPMVRRIRRLRPTPQKEGSLDAAVPRPLSGNRWLDEPVCGSPDSSAYS